MSAAAAAGPAAGPATDPATGDAVGAAAGRTVGGALPRALAFYLPQFHPIPENDAWWGPGFTEWRNVTRAAPRFPGHYQPHLPGELGFYDLRVPEVRAAQAELARDHGISGFVYYHYWFHGRRLLERPFDEVLASGEPDFPFALCWSNEPWRREWDQTGDVLMPQHFSPEDDLAHIRWLATAFADPRYITIDGRPLFLVERPALLPDPVRTTDTWRAEAQRLGFPDLYLCWVARPGDTGRAPVAGSDAVVLGDPWIDVPADRAGDDGRPRRIEYGAAPAAPVWPSGSVARLPSVVVGWDDTPRRREGGTVLVGATPEAYGDRLRRACSAVGGEPAGGQPTGAGLVFLQAWNRWSDGCHLEPDQRYGRSLLEVTRQVLAGLPVGGSGSRNGPGSGSRNGLGGRSAGSAPDPTPHDDGIRARADRLLLSLVPDRTPRAAVLRLSGGPGGAGARTAPTTGLTGEAERVVDAVAVDVTSIADIAGGMAEVGPIDGVYLLDVLHHLPGPEALLSELSAWCRSHGAPALVVSSPNATSFEEALRLLCGRWEPGPDPAPGVASGAPLSAERLERLFEECGWRVATRDHRRAEEVADLPTVEGLPPELRGALAALARAYNPDADVDRFVWVVLPEAPGSGTEAPDAGTEVPGRVPAVPDEGDDRLGPAPAPAPASPDPDRLAELSAFLVAAGLVEDPSLTSPATADAAAAAAPHGSPPTVAPPPPPDPVRSLRPRWLELRRRFVETAPRSATVLRKFRDVLR